MNNQQYVQNIIEELWEVLQQDFKVNLSRSSVSLLEKILNAVSRMFWEHSPVHASFSPRTSFNAKALISLSQLCTRQRSIFPWNSLTESQQYWYHLRQGIYEWKWDFTLWLMLRIKHVHMDLIQDKDHKLSILC